jgi:hypothetical protein
VKAVAFVLVVLAGLSGFFIAPKHGRTLVVRDAAPAETVCVTNLAPQFISDATIKRDIPAWEHSVNVDFAAYWHTAHYRILFMGRKPAPQGCISAVFQAKGPVAGALAYHWTERNNLPSITVYAGTGDYYGFDNSVSFDHEMKELAADPVTSYLNVGYTLDTVWLEKRDTSIAATYNLALGWMSEVADPVEADTYTWRGVKLSDFVTPAWFGDGTGARFDFLGLCQQPLWLRPGGYATYLGPDGWHQVLNFRHGHPSDAGFSKEDPGRPERR